MSERPKGTLDTETTDNGTPIKTREFLHYTVEHGVFNVLDVRSRNLIGVYFATEATLRQLRPLVDNASWQYAQQLIVKGMRRMLGELPTHIQDQFPEQETIKLKSRVWHCRQRWQQNESYRNKVTAAL